MMIDCSIGTTSFVFQFPCILSLIVEQLRVVVSLVEIFQNGRQDLWLFVW
jgi:hypothetical protein